MVETATCAVNHSGAHAAELIVQRDPDLENLLPALPEDDRAALAEKLGEEGCWQEFPYCIIDGEAIQLGGHHRRTLCDESSVRYGWRLIPHVKTKGQAIEWIVADALAQRKLTPEQIGYYRGREYLQSKHDQGGNRKSSAQNEHLIGSTAEKIGKKHHVSAATIRRDAQFAAQVDSRLCDRCKRIGVPACETCKKLLSQSVKKSVQKKSKARLRRTTGNVKWDQKWFDRPFGELLRVIDTFGNAFGRKESRAANALRTQLGEYKKSFDEWVKETTGEAVPQ